MIRAMRSGDRAHAKVTVLGFNEDGIPVMRHELDERWLEVSEGRLRVGD